MTILNTEQAKSLYQIAQAEIKSWGLAKSCAETWEHNVRFPLYALAVEVAGVQGMSDAQIFPTIFGTGFELIAAVVPNEYWFWRIADEFSLCSQINRCPIFAAKHAISAVRSGNMRQLCRRSALNPDISPKDAVKLAAIGVLLWDFTAEDYLLNPLYFSPSELAQRTSPISVGGKP